MFEKYERKPMIVWAMKLPVKAKVPTPDGLFTGQPGDYLIIGVGGDMSLCEPEDFEKEYGLEGVEKSVPEIVKEKQEEIQKEAEEVEEAPEQEVAELKPPHTIKQEKDKILFNHLGNVLELNMQGIEISPWEEIKRDRRDEIGRMAELLKANNEGMNGTQARSIAAQMIREKYSNQIIQKQRDVMRGYNSIYSDVKKDNESMQQMKEVPEETKQPICEFCQQRPVEEDDMCEVCKKGFDSMESPKKP